ncbi:hypothetical protein [Methylomicrobium sp. Wu6]|uniref:hypothetical protein n=1 Tax=Methylomicrobium sp. Wu6 TaxID=3107928 RepID=UPI002DD63EA2|nr:hypothetical protein [Methylomicrobium sp. Wu6]MEC4747482.1 hypothetical protein [Methylomicrobium sp. Wu6]
MSLHHCSFRHLTLFAAVLLTACAETRQIAVDRPEMTAQPLQPPAGFQSIDGDDYYVRVVSEFSAQGENFLKGGCSDLAPYQKGDLSAALVYRVRNDVVKFQGEASGFLYQAATGKCNFKFDAKKLYLTPWLRLDTGKETQVDYDFYTNANSDLDVSSLVGDVNAASGILALTGAGLGVAIMGQMAGQWVQSNQQNAPVQNQSSAKQSSESHSLPGLAVYSGKTGKLNQAAFKVFQIDEGGFNLFGPETKPLGELKVYPEIASTLLLRAGPEGVPDARDLSFEELRPSPIISVAGNINLAQLIEQSQHPDKPNLKPDWKNYSDVETDCRKLKLTIKALGFNKFDRNALLYYFLANSGDWKNYNIDRRQALDNEIRPKTMAGYRKKNFGNCLAEDDYAVMKAMGLAVNTPADWDQLGATSRQQEQLFSPLQSIERQLLAVLRNTSAAEMERQLYPLLMAADKVNGKVLLQNHLGDFGLESLLNPPAATAPVAPVAVNTALPPVPSAEVSSAVVPVTSPVSPIPGEGAQVGAKQLAEVFLGLKIGELSCARPAPGQQGKGIGILLFTTKEGSPRAKGGALEFEFADGKINRIAFQLPTYRDFEQDIADRPEVGGCRIDPAWLAKLK